MNTSSYCSCNDGGVVDYCCTYIDRTLFLNLGPDRMFSTIEFGSVDFEALIAYNVNDVANEESYRDQPLIDWNRRGV
jgi:hypothetical protein